MGAEGRPTWPERHPGPQGRLLCPLTCRCSRSSSSVTFWTWASSATEIRSTWCLGRGEGETEGLRSPYWPCTLPGGRRAAGGPETQAGPRSSGLSRGSTMVWAPANLLDTADVPNPSVDSVSLSKVSRASSCLFPGKFLLRPQVSRAQGMALIPPQPWSLVSLPPRVCLSVHLLQRVAGG